MTEPSTVGADATSSTAVPTSSTTEPSTVTKGTAPPGITREILDRAARSDRAALDLVARVSLEPMRRVAAKVLRCRGDVVDEIVQTSWVRLASDPSGLRALAPCELLGWLCGWVRHDALAFGRARSRRSTRIVLGDELIGRVGGPQGDPCAMLDALTILGGLTPEDRQLILWTEYEGMDCAEIARTLKRLLPTVQSQVQRARVRLQALVARATMMAGRIQP